MPIQDMLVGMDGNDSSANYAKAVLQLEDKLSVIIRKQHFIEHDAAPSNARALFGGIGIDFGNAQVSDLMELEEMVKKWLQQYTKVMRAYADEGGTGLALEGIYPVQEFCRKLQYARTSYEYFEMGLRIQGLHPLSCSCLYDARIYIAGRIHWVEVKRREGKDPYAIENRYRGRHTYLPLLLSYLPMDRKWIADLTIVPELEIHCLMVLAWKIRREHRYIDRVLENLRQHRHNTPPNIEEVTADWTYEAMASKDKFCDICTYKYGPTFSDAWQTEPAVKTACNHVLGKFCVQTWMNMHNTCPFCRSELYNPLPVQVQQLHDQILEERKKISELDEEVDSYFLGEPKVACGKKMDALLRNLDSRYQEAIRLYVALGALLSSVYA